MTEAARSPGSPPGWEGAMLAVSCPEDSATVTLVACEEVSAFPPGATNGAAFGLSVLLTANGDRERLPLSVSLVVGGPATDGAGAPSGAQSSWTDKTNWG